MTETDIEREPIARQLWDMTQRIAVQVAEKPIVLREAAFAIAARAFADMARDMNVQEDKRDGVVKLQMELLRQLVTEIDVGGSPQGGNA